VFEGLFRGAEVAHSESGYARSSIGMLKSMSRKAIENVKEGRI